MATRTKKKAAAKVNDSITFKKSELIAKLTEFLENQGACDGDWLNKVRVEFLGEKLQTVEVRLQYETTVELEMASSDVPTADEVAIKIRTELTDGNMDIDIDDWSDFKVLSVEKVEED